jgi:hypothetical protein
MRLYNGNLFLGVPDLVGYGVSEAYVCKAVRQHRAGAASWVNVPDPLDKRRVLIAYDSIPPATRAKLPTKAEILAMLRDEQVQLRATELVVAGSALVSLHAKAVQTTDYNFFFSKAGLTATPDASVEVKASQLTQAAGWLRLLAGLTERHQLRALGFERKEEVREAVLTEVLPLNLYGLRVSNVRVLQQKELAFAKALVLGSSGEKNLSVHELKQEAHQRALLTLVPKRYGVANAQKIGKIQGENGAKVALGARIDGGEWHANNIIYLFMNPGSGAKFDLKEVYRRYCRRAEAAEKEPMSFSGMKNFLKRPEVRLVTAWERDGYAAFDKFLPHQLRERPSYSLSKGGYDGFSVDFYTSITKPDGQKATIMLTVVAVFDFHSEAITGYSVGLVENGKLVRDMYRNHLRQTGGKSYIEIESDRFSGNLADDTQQMFSRACQHVTRPVPQDTRGKAANPKARLAERLLAEVNRLTQNIKGWKGTNITSIDPNRKPNPDYAGEEVQATLATGIRQINELIAVYNHQPVEKWNGQTRWERLKADFNPEAPELDALTQATLLSQHTVVKVLNAKVSITVAKKVYDYEFPQYVRYTHLMGKGMKVRVYYDETDMSEVSVFGFTDAKDPGTDMFLLTLKRGQRVQMAKAEQVPGDLVLLGKKEKQRADMRDEFDRKQLELEAAMHGVDAPGSMPLKALKAMIVGLRLSSGVVEDFGTRFSEVLSSPDAVAQLAHYDDNLLRNEGHRVPVTTANMPKKQGLTARERLKLYGQQGHDFSQ